MMVLMLLRCVCYGVDGAVDGVGWVRLLLVSVMPVILALVLVLLLLLHVGRCVDIGCCVGVCVVCGGGDVAGVVVAIVGSIGVGVVVGGGVDDVGGVVGCVVFVVCWCC